jgi:hypothetical protein
MAIDIPAATYRHNDFSQYYAGARAVATGRSPYDDAFWVVLRDIGSTALFAKPYATVGDTGLTTPYPLWVFALLSPMGLLPLAVAAPAFLMAQLTALLTALIAAARRLLPSARRERLVFAAIAATFQPLWLVVVGGNIAGLVAAGFIGAVAAALAGRPRLAGGLLAMCLLKPNVVVVAGAVILVALEPKARARALSGFVLVAAVLVAIAFAIDPSWPAPWWRNVTALQATTWSNATAWTIDRALGSPRWTAPLAVALALGSFVAWALMRRPAPSTLIAGAVPLSIFVAPHAWSYDAAPLLVTVAVLVAIVGRMAGVAGTLGLAVIFALAVALPWAAYALAFRRGGEEWTALAVLLFFPLVALADRLNARIANLHSAHRGT